MDDDGQTSSIFGNYTSWQMGRWSAEAEQEQQEILAKLTGTASVSARDYNHALQILEQWRVECHRLQQLNANQQAQLNAAKAYQGELKTWADRCAADRDRWKERFEHQRNQTRRIGERANRFQDELERLKGDA